MPDETEDTNEATPEPEQPEAVDPQADAADADGDQLSPDDEQAPVASDDEAAALAAAMSAIGQVQGIADSVEDPGGQSSDGEPFQEPVFEHGGAGTGNEGLDLLSDVNLSVRIELGRTKMFVEDVLKLNDGAVVELDKLAGDPVDVFVNNRHVAKGEVLVLNENFCVRINEIVTLKED